MKSQIIHKSFSLKDATIDDAGILRGGPAGIGNLDSYEDVIFPGFFGDDCLSDFLKRGFNSPNHDWDTVIGYPTVAKERGNVLYSEMQFHTTPTAQEYRTICKERLEAGMEVGLSIGFSTNPGGAKYFNSGEELLAFAKENGYDIKLFDVPGIMAHKGRCRGLLKNGCKRLYEWSIATVQANDNATAAEAKAHRGPETPEGDEMKKYKIEGGVFKGAYLGDWVEASMSLAVLDSACSTLYYRVADCLYDMDEYASPDDCLIEIDGMIDEFAALTKMAIRAVMAGSAAEDAKSFAKSVRDNREDPAELDVPHAGTSLKNQLGAALAAVQGCIQRVEGYVTVKSTDGRPVASERRNQIVAIQDAATLLSASIEPKPAESEIQRVAMEVELTRSRLLGIAV